MSKLKEIKNMTLKQITTKLATIKPGRIVKVHYKTIKGDYSKETKTTVRFVEYAHIKGVVPKGKGNGNENHIIKNMLIYNNNTKKYYLQMATIKTNHNAQVNYFYNGKPITKADYDLANPPRPNTQPLVVFRKDIADIISIG